MTPPASGRSPGDRPTVELGGLKFAPLTRGEVVDRVFDELAEGRGGWMITANVDYVRRSVEEPGVNDLLSGATLIVPDGMPLLWAARFRGTPLPDRVAGSDLVWLIAKRAAPEARSIYLLGGPEGVAEVAAARLIDTAPGLRIAGVSSPMVSADPTEAELLSVRESLKAAKPDVIYVSLGAPKEERLIAALRSHVPDAWWIGVGASLSFIAGHVARAPRWIQASGFEWLHRLAQEPRRLGKRYLIDDLPFAVRLLVGARFQRVSPNAR